MAVTLSEITTDAHGNGTVIWSDTLNGTARTPNTVFTLPTNLQPPNITVLFGEVTYPYTPPLGYVMTGTINIYQSMYFYPRLSTTITRVNSEGFANSVGLALGEHPSKDILKDRFAR